MKSKRFVFLSVIILIITGCDIINPDEDIPAYIQIDTIALQTNYNQGSNSSKIVDAWVFIDDQTIGAFELPVTFPVLLEGKHDIKIVPGIMLNGTAGLRSIHPFLEVTKGEIELIPEEVNTNYKTLTTTFQDDVTFPFNVEEDFESGGIIFEKVGKSDTIIQKVTDPQYLMPDYGGNGCGAIFMDTAHDLFEGATTELYTIPSTVVFLEFDYKTENYFSFGYISSLGLLRELIFIKPNDEWNKIYFNLTPYIQEISSTDKFKIYINADLDRENEEAVILLDNIKLMYE